MSEIGNGWSWYKFDIEGWLSSPDVQQMNFNDRGVYHHLLTIQARDGKLLAEMSGLKNQTGVDKRTLESWFKKWGYLFPIIDIDPDVELTSLRPCNVHVTSASPTCNACVTPPLPLRCFPAASWMRGRNARVNPKQWNLSVKSGKFIGQPILEEKREVLDIEETETHINVRLTMKPKSQAKGEGA